MQDWMMALAEHYNRMRRHYPHDRLLIVFDIDGTILDMRHLVVATLRSYDETHATNHFSRLALHHIDVHECNIAPLLPRLDVAPADRSAILTWYYAHHWTSEILDRAQVAFDGILPLIRWLQRRHKTYVGMNTGRPETQRWQTMRALNRLGAPHGVYFNNRLLHMCPNGWARTVPDSKALGIQRFRKQDYRVIAMIDNEPENLVAVDAIDPNRQILLMHADTLFHSASSLLPSRSVRGHRFDPTTLARASRASAPPASFVHRSSRDEAPLDRPLTSL